MSATDNTDELLDELDEQELSIPVEDESASVPTLSCDADDHNGEPIREGEHAVLLLVRNADGDWEINSTYCNRCQVLDEYCEIDSDGTATAVVEGVAVPENELGPSKSIHLRDAFLWDLYEDQREH